MVDQTNATALLSRTVGVLDKAGISCASSFADAVSVWLRVKADSRVWLSLTATGLSPREQRGLSEHVVSVLTSAGLRLVSIKQAEDLESTGRLLRSEVLYVESSVV